MNAGQGYRQNDLAQNIWPFDPKKKEKKNVLATSERLKGSTDSKFCGANGSWCECRSIVLYTYLSSTFKL